MAVNALIAQGIRPLGADVPEIAQMLQQRRQQTFQNSLASAANTRAQAEFNQKLSAESDVKKQQDAQRAIAEADQLSRIPDDQLAQYISQSLPHVAAAAEQAGILPNDIQRLRQMSSIVRMKAATYLGQSPPQMQLKEVPKEGSLIGLTPTPSGGFTSTTLASGAPAEETFGAPFDAVKDGKPGVFARGNRGTIKQLDGMTPYNKPTAGGGSGGAAGALTPDTIHDAVIDVLTDPARIRQYASYGQSGQTNRNLINNSKSKLLREIGLTEQEVIRQQAIAKGQVKSASDLVGMQNAVNAYETVASGNGARVLELVEKVNTSGVPLGNTLSRIVQQHVAGSADAAELMQVLQNYQTEVARIIANPRLVGQLTDTARKEIETAVPANMTLAQAKRIVNRLNFEFELRNKGISDSIAQAQGQMVPGYGANATPQTAAPTVAPTTRPPLSSFGGKP